MAQNSFSTIPHRLISLATLEYVGFSADKAMAIWNAWNNIGQATDEHGEGVIIPFIDYITGPFDSRGEYVDDGDDEKWRQTMNGFGLSADFQERIMHPVFKELRLTQSCAYWCKDTVEMRYEALQYIQESSMNRQRLLEGAQGNGHDHSLSGSSHQTAGPAPIIGPVMPPPAHSQGEQQQSEHHPQEPAASAPASIFDNFESINDIPARGIDGHTLLFKGIAKTRVEGFLDAEGSIQDIATLLSSAPSDFSSSRGLFYFTPDFEIAQYYAGYAKLRATHDTTIVIICIAIPNQAIQGLTGDSLQHLYWPSEEWKEYVRCNRARKPVPSALRRFRRATLLIGSMGKKNNYAWRQLLSARGVTEDFVVMVHGQPVVQYVFDGSDECQDFLRENIAPQPYIYQLAKNDWDFLMTLTAERHR